MSITTKRGDKGFTDLLFGGKASKGDPQIEALGAVDELNANLGIARVLVDGEVARAIDQIQEWDNLDNLPLFMTATCKFSYFDNPEEKSAGELLLLNDEGGAIALLSTTRLVYSAPNYNLNTKFIQTIFEKENGEFKFPRLGDVFKTTKFRSGTSSNNRNFTLLGDPALRLAHPRFDVNTTVINDTLKALGEVSIEGQIENESMLFSDFNGTVFVTVYDKEIIKTTLGQESCVPMPYRDQNNLLYKGAATVSDGKFSFSFIVPKAVSYTHPTLPTILLV